MKCDVILPVGPGHEQIYQQAADSVTMACMNTGIFDEVTIKVVDDTEGKMGRSRARNDAVKSSDADWLFFLDADDLMHPDAFRDMATHDLKDAVFGNIYETANGVAVWRYQAPEISSYEQFISVAPYHAVQMGHFVKREVALELPFDESMNCGEDYDYYLRLWKKFDCVKTRDCFMLNRKGAHSTGPRSATGQEWSEAVEGMRSEAMLEARPFQFKFGYWFPSTDTHFTENTFELSHLDYCIEGLSEGKWIDDREGYSVALDVGAHVGAWSKRMAGFFDKVISFEADKMNFQCLKKNTSGLSNVVANNLAVGKDSGRAAVHQGVDPGNSGQGYIVDGDDVQVIALDEFNIEHVDFIKIDVEGFEPFVLEGARDLIKRNRPAILIEQTPGISNRYDSDYLEAGRILEDMGYRLEKQMNKNYLYVPVK